MMNDAEYLDFVEKTVQNFNGLGDDLSAALGALSIGRLVGWRVLCLIHSESTIRRYEKVLGIRFKDELVEEGKYAQRSLGYRLVKKLGSYWQVVQGRQKLPRLEKVAFSD